MPHPLEPRPHAADATWARELRAHAADALDMLELPTGHEEEWRFSHTGRLSLDHLTVPDPEVAAGFDTAAVQAVADGLGSRSALVVSTAGGTAVLEPAEPAAGVEVLPLAEVDVGSRACELVRTDQDIFAALNARHFSGGVSVAVSAGVSVAAPVVVVHWVESPDAAVFPRTLIEVGESAECRVVEVWASPPDLEGALVAPVVELFVDDDAHLDHVGIQQLADTAIFVGSQHARVLRDSRLTTASANVGAAVGRLRVEADLAGCGAEYDAFGLYVGDGDRNVDFRTLQHHLAANTRSRLLFRGAVLDHAESIYSGLIRIDPHAARSDAHQASHYLILSEHARAASIPNLEIFNHDVRCGHASSGGPPDADQLYYLGARGISPEVAERLVVDGFFHDVISQFPLEAVREVITREVMRRLAIARRAAAA